MARRPRLRLRIALYFAALALGGPVAVAAGLWLGHARAGGPGEGYVIAGVVAFFGLAGLAVWTWHVVDDHLARPMLALAAELQTRASTRVPSQIDPGTAPRLPELADAARAAASALEEARASLEQALAEQTARIARDKALLEALLRELADGVVVVAPNLRILLYNRAAAALLGPLGLDRPLDRFLAADPVLAAIDRLANADTPGGAAMFLTSPVDGEQVITGTVSAADLGQGRTGHVLHFRDMTEDLRSHGDLERLLRQTIEGARRPASAMGAILDVLEAVPDMDQPDRARFDASLREELGHLTGMLEDSAAMEQALNAAHWPIHELGVQQIFHALRARMPDALGIVPSDAVVRCDGYAISETLGLVALALSEKPDHGDFTLSAERAGDEVRLHLAWRGPSLPLGELERWLSRPLADAYGDYTVRDALTAHRSDIWVEPAHAGARIVLPLPAADAPDRLHTPGALQFYDFGLPSHADPDLGRRPMTDLAFTVFDTETTGLDPERDEVVQISGVRIVGGRLLRDEVFDQLVNPGRPIPPGSTEVHRISDDMVAGAPPFDTVAEDFLRFAEGSVLVAHHAVFDMAFLHRHAGRDGGTLNLPVLCTALMSSRLFPHTGDHTLDGLAARCGVVIEEAQRHTALGDALATAEILLKLIQLSGAQGIETLNDALAWQSAG